LWGFEVLTGVKKTMFFCVVRHVSKKNTISIFNPEDEDIIFLKKLVSTYKST
jgi:hypothetical protein